MLQSAARDFQPALKAKSLDSLLGLTRYFQIRKQFSKALEAINQVIVRHAWFTPALLTKARLLLSMSEWTDAKSTHSDSSRSRRKCGRIGGSSGEVEQIVGSYRRNASLYYSTSLSFSRLVGRNKKLLALTLGLAERQDVFHSQLLKILLARVISLLWRSGKLDRKCVRRRSHVLVIISVRDCTFWKLTHHSHSITIFTRKAPTHRWLRRVLLR